MLCNFEYRLVELEAMISPNRTSPLDVPLSRNSDLQLQDVKPDTATPSAFDRIHRRQIHQLIIEFLASLSARDRMVLMYRLGFDGVEHTLKEIGEQLLPVKITKERVRQIERESLQAIREKFRDHPAVLELFKRTGNGSWPRSTSSYRVSKKVFGRRPKKQKKHLGCG